MKPKCDCDPYSCEPCDSCYEELCAIDRKLSSRSIHLGESDAVLVVHWDGSVDMAIPNSASEKIKGKMQRLIALLDSLDED